MEWFFGGNSLYSGKIFTLHKKTVRIMAGVQPWTSCRSLFKQLEIHLFLANTLMNFSIIDQENFQTNSSILRISKRNKHQLHRPNSSLSCFQKNTFYADIKLSNSLPLSLKILNNDEEKFKAALSWYLIHTPFTLYMKFLYGKVIYNTVL
jgi:hypothetical protein